MSSYSKAAVQKAIDQAARRSPPMSRRERNAIHRLLKGRHGHGTCPACRADGMAWDTPNEAGRCYQCNGELE